MNKFRIRKLTFMAAWALLMVAVVGCSSSQTPDNTAEPVQPPSASTGETKPPQPAAPPEPVTISIFRGISIDDESMDAMFTRPIQAKFPHVTPVIVKPGTGTQITDLIASGTVPDILFIGFNVLKTHQGLDLPLDLRPFQKASQVNMSQFPAALNESLDIYSEAGETYAMPLYMNIPAMYYNKDLFDRFGVAYPTDGMKWNEAIDLGRRLSRTVDGVQYIGFHPGNWSFMAGQFALGRIDPKTNLAVFNTPDLKTIFETLKEGTAATQVPYVAFPGTSNGMFLKDRTIAMYTMWLNNLIGEFENMHKEGNPLNWDMVQQPTFHGMNSQVDSHFMSLSTTGKHQQQSWDIIHYLSTDMEYQRAISRLGRIPVLTDEKLQLEFAADLQSAKGKNMQVLVKNRIQKAHVPSLYDALANTQLNQAFNKMIQQNADINTVLREAEEATNRAVEAELKK